MRRGHALLGPLFPLLLACASAEPPRTATVAGARSAPPPVPAQKVATLDGRRTDLAHAAEGKVALVSFWATWCEACSREIGALNRLAERAAKRDDAVVIGVAVGESVSSVDAFARSHGMGYVQLVDEDFSLADALGQRHVPATMVIDRNGRVIYRGDVLDGAGLAAFRSALDEAEAPARVSAE